MKRTLKLVCTVIALALVVGALVYGASLAAYRLADAFSLSPALKNLAPLGALAVVWLIASRATKYFQRRSRRQTDSTRSSTEGQLGCDKDEEQRQAWLQIKAKGKKRYVWRTGVVGWGLPVFAIFTPAMLIFGPRTHALSNVEIVGTIVFSLFIWTLGGYFFGLWMWKTLDKQYR